MLTIGTFLPLAMWMFLFRSFLWGNIIVNLDTQSYYTQIKYYINNLLNGVFPLWDPFIFLGRPFYSTVLNGAFNPLLSLMAVLVRGGVDYYHAFMLYLVVFMMLGAAGFYFLSRAVLKSRLYAFMAYALFLFSGMTAGIFTQSAILLIFVPGVWFFFFLIRFFNAFKKRYLLGMTFAAMLIGTSYIPFHFATLLFIFILCYAGLYYKRLPQLLKDFCGFSAKNRMTAVFCLLAVAVAASPLIAFKLSDSRGGMVSPARHCSFKSPQACYEEVMKNDAAMTYVETARTGSLGERARLAELFLHLDKRSYHTDDFFYLPLIVFVIIAISCWTGLDRKKILVFIMTCILFLISLGEATPVSRFFYEHVFYFKYFRNLFYFSIFIMPLLILFSVMQLKSLVEYKMASAGEKRGHMLLIVGVHLAFVSYLLVHGDTMVSSYATIILSLVFFVYFLARGSHGFKNYWLIGLLGIALLQPAQVFYAYAKNASEEDCAIPRTHSHVAFSYVRPEKAVESPCAIYRYRPYIVYWYDMALQDAPPVIKGAERISKGVYFLSHRIGEEVLLQYAKNKFYLYDHVDAFNGDEDIGRLRDVLKNNKNVALIDGAKGIVLQDASLGDPAERALVVHEGSDAFRVVRFDVNALTITTNFLVPKFLVYTDSYAPAWKVFINGRQADLYQANGAFKGFWVPAGSNTIHLTFLPKMSGNIFMFIVFFFNGFLIYMVLSFYKKRKE